MRLLINSHSIKKQYFFIGAAVFAVAGTILLIRSFAATPGVIAFEGENTQPQGNAVTAFDFDASGGSFIEFGAADTPPPPPPPPPPATTPPPPPPSTLPGGGWYAITSGQFETTRFTLKAGSASIYQPISIGKYDSGQFPKATASGVTSFVDKAAGADYAAAPDASRAAGILFANFTDGYNYEKGVPSFGSPSVNGTCVSAPFRAGSMSNYTLTACQNHGVLRVVNHNTGVLGEEDKIYAPGNAADSTFAVINTTSDVTGHGALLQAWRQSDAQCSGFYGFSQGDAQSIECMVNLMGGNTSTVFYKDHIIVGFYNKITGQGLGFVYPRSYTQFFGESRALKGLNPFFPVANILAWEYLTNAGAPQTRYIFPLSNGRTDLNAIGKGILDGGYF